MSNERKLEIQNFRIELSEKTFFTDFKKNRINQKIKSITISRSSSPSIVIKAKLKEGDEFTLVTGKVINLEVASQGVVLSWEAYEGEWAEIDISEGEKFVPYNPPQTTTLVSNVAVKRIVHLIDMYWVAYGTSQTKLMNSNPNRIKMEIEVFGFSRIFIGDYEQTKDVTSVTIRQNECDTIMPFCKKTLDSSEELWSIADENFLSMYNEGINPNGLTIKIVEYVR